MFDRIINGLQKMFNSSNGEEKDKMQKIISAFLQNRSSVEKFIEEANKKAEEKKVKCTTCNDTGIERNGVTKDGKTYQYVCDCEAGRKLEREENEKRKKEPNIMKIVYHKEEGFPFEVAMLYMRDGREVSNKNWNGKGMKVYLQDAYEDDNMMSYLEMELANKKVVPYSPSQADIIRGVRILAD